MAQTFFITTAIDYTNGAPHIGHAYEKVLADVLARYHRLKGDDVFFLTGVDQHGQKVQQSAEKAGVSPQQFVDEITKKFVALWKKLEVDYSAWAATTDPLHKECVRANLQKLWDDKDPATGASKWLYKKTERGWYSVRQEQFLTDKERGANGEFGPEWQPVEEREEENFYFRLKEHKQWLLDLIDKRHPRKEKQDSQDLQDSASRQEKGNPVNPENLVNPVQKQQPLVIPEFRASELRNAVEKLEGDLCISRPAARLKWGIPFPETFGAGFVTYVWFDALVNYISFAPGHDTNFTAETQRRREEETGSDLRASAPLRFKDWWPPVHVIGKDILIPAHGVYWPIMLKALGFSDDEMPTLLVHGWWNIAGAKMSKSTGNIVDPDALADKYGAETLRYYLMSDIATGRDSDFSEERLVMRYNVDPANSLGNLLNRMLTMVAKYRNQCLRKNEADFVFGPSSLSDLRTICRNVSSQFTEAMEKFEIHSGLLCGFALAEHCNVLVECAAPWKLAKDDSKINELDAVFYHLAESLRIIAILISPVMPKAARGIFDQLDPEGKLSRDFRLADATWGGLPDGHVVGKPVPLFPRIEAPKE